MKKLHYYSGILITLFTGFHLFNHAWSIAGPEAHIALMDDLRIVYRNPVAETLLLLAVFFQVFSGLQFFRRQRKMAVAHDK